MGVPHIFHTITQKAKQSFGIKVDSFITALSPKDYLKIPACLFQMLESFEMTKPSFAGLEFRSPTGSSTV